MAYIQQLYLYGHAGLETYVDNDFMKSFRKGSRPEKRFDKDQIETIKTFALSSVDQLREDSGSEGILRKSYKPFAVTAKEILLPTLDDALSFIACHDTMHVGAMKSLKRFVV